MKTLILSPHKDNPSLLCAPTVGYFSAALANGTLVEAEQIVGEMQILNQKIQVQMPEGAVGRIEWTTTSPHHQPVAYGEAIASWAPTAMSNDPKTLHKEKGSKGTHYKTPMEGLFYCRPDPESEPFVKEGQKLKPGAQIGLIEVMKTFYPIYFEGDKTKTIRSIEVKDAQPVEMGTTLFIFN